MLQRFEGFDLLSETGTDPTDLIWKGIAYGVGTSTFSYVAGKFAGNAIRLNAAADVLYVPYLQEVTSSYVGFWFRTSALPGGNSAIAEFHAASDITEVHLSVQLASNGSLLLVGPGGTLATSSPSDIGTNVWYFIEVELTVNNSTGTCQVWINESSVASATSSDTQDGTNTKAGVISLVGAASADRDFDDLYIVDTTAGTGHPVTRLGYITVAAMLPDGNGASAQFTATGAASNWQAVDESVPDGDTTYVSSSTVGHLDIYSMAAPDVAYTGSTDVIAVQTSVLAKKDAPGPRSLIMSLSPDDGVTSDDSAAHGLSPDYTYLPVHISVLNPDSVLAWEYDELASLYVMEEVV